MDPKRLLTIMAHRLYEDIKFVAEQNPTQPVDDDGAKAYNSLVAKARKIYGGLDHMADFSDWAARTIKYKDALLVAGQFSAMLEALTAGDTRMPSRSGTSTGTSAPGAPQVTPLGLPPRVHVPQGPPPPMPQMPQAPPQAPSPPIDVELYGPAVSTPKRNDDGTIPFSLD